MKTTTTTQANRRQRTKRFGMMAAGVMAAGLLGLHAGATAGIIGHWTFDDGSGTSAADAVNSNDATLFNTPTWQASAKIGGGLEFDKDSNEYGVVDSVSQVPTGDYASLTMSIWVQPTEAPVDNWADDSGIWQLRTDSDGLVGFSVVRDNNPYEDVDDVQFRGMTRPIDQAARSNGDILQNGTWVHLVGIYEGTDDATNEDYLSLYADGVLVASNTDETHKTLSNTLEYEWYFGRDEFSPSRDIDAILDDAAMWDEALSATEVAALFDFGDTGDLNYDAGTVTDLFGLFDAGSGALTVDGLKWQTTSGITGVEGDVYNDGGFWFVALDGEGNGLRTIPEPTTGLLLLLGGGALLLRRRARRA